jgi:hypothetical protein
MMPSDRVAIAAHLHVLLRRRTGRVTDTEWMATNADYAAAMVRFARQHAVEDRVPELEEWATRLERAWAPLLDPHPSSSAPGAPAVQRLPGGPNPPASGPRYVGGIR